uniref:HP1D2 n=2 Tax=Drosophila eugracilis TaxID=29029 RepID=A0A142I117_DROEU|nr:HP1D2 [Drosophila eugracilis]
MSSEPPEKQNDSTSKPITPDENEFIVEKIIGKRFARGRPQYLIKWLGFPEKDNSWEPLEGVAHCSTLLADFEAELFSRNQQVASGSNKKSKGKKQRNDSGSKKAPELYRDLGNGIANVTKSLENSKGRGRGRKSKFKNDKTPAAPPSPSLDTAPATQKASELSGSVSNSKGQSKKPLENKLESPQSLMKPQIGAVSLSEVDTSFSEMQLNDQVTKGRALSEQSSSSDSDSASGQAWRMPPCTEPFGVRRGLELEKVHHSFKVRDVVILFVTWKDCSTMDAVPLDDIKHAYPMPIIKYFQSLKRSTE